MKERKTVLVADDSRAVLDALATAFGEAGWEVAAASDGADVFRKLSALDPQAVLLDLYVPDLNGADMCRLVKAHPHWKKIFLVVMSSRIGDAEMGMYRRLGADAVLKKPFDPEHVVALATRALGEPPAE